MKDKIINVILLIILIVLSLRFKGCSIRPKTKKDVQATQKVVVMLEQRFNLLKWFEPVGRNILNIFILFYLSCVRKDAQFFFLIKDQINLGIYLLFSQYSRIFLIKNLKKYAEPLLLLVPGISKFYRVFKNRLTAQ